jgi:hypothetical protein
MSISTEIGGFIINAVFDSIQQLSKAEKSRASRQVKILDFYTSLQCSSSVLNLIVCLIVCV